jgi:hypothetical protein
MDMDTYTIHKGKRDSIVKKLKTKINM